MCVLNIPIYLRILVVISGPIILALIDYILFKYTNKLRSVIVAISGVIMVFWIFYFTTVMFFARC